MAIKTIEKIRKYGANSLIYGYSYSEDTPNDKKLTFQINKNKRTIEFYPFNSKYLFFNKLYLDGFDKLPDIFKKTGYSKNRLLDKINKTFGNKSIKSVTITRTGKSSIIKRGRDKHLRLSLSCLRDLSDEIGSMDFHFRKRKWAVVNKHFNSELPKLIKLNSAADSKGDIKTSIQNLNIQKSENFDKDDIDKITNILVDLMRSSHRTQIIKSQLFKKTKLKIDTVTLDKVIEEFESKLRIKPSESSWGEFLQNNLFLIDSKYIHPIPQLNLVLGGTRKVDFGLVDIQGYLDLFEIKKPETKLLTAKKDSRGNYIWDHQAIEAIVQAEKYLLHAESKRNDLKEDIRREKQIVLDVLRPRAFVIMGSSSQFDNTDKKEDFRVLKNQFKNIEIILYDELLERIKNQKKSIDHS